MTRRILLPVDGSEGSVRAARFVAELARSFHDPEVHLVNVQPHGDDWMVRRIIDEERLERMEREWSEAALAPAREALAGSAVAVREHFRQGEVAKSIVALCDELGCDQIVMGTRGLSALGELLLGSVAHKVLHLAKVPVTFVK